MKQNLSELHFTGGLLSPPKAECTLHMRPRSSTMCADVEQEKGSGATMDKQRDNLTNLQLSPVQKHKLTVRLLYIEYIYLDSFKNHICFLLF